MLVIPAYKMKLNKEFKLPLSSQALEILEFMYKQKLDNFVFSCALSDKVRMQRKKKRSRSIDKSLLYIML